MEGNSLLQVATGTLLKCVTVHQTQVRVCGLWLPHSHSPGILLQQLRKKFISQEAQDRVSCLYLITSTVSLSLAAFGLCARTSSDILLMLSGFLVCCLCDVSTGLLVVGVRSCSIHLFPANLTNS